MTKQFSSNKSGVTNMMVKTVTDVDLGLSDTRVLQGKRSVGKA